MATGGIFQLIVNNGKSDYQIMATDFLEKRLAKINAAKKANPTTSALAGANIIRNLDVEQMHMNELKKENIIQDFNSDDWTKN